MVDCILQFADPILVFGLWLIFVAGPLLLTAPFIRSLNGRKTVFFSLIGAVIALFLKSVFALVRVALVDHF